MLSLRGDFRVPARRTSLLLTLAASAAVALAGCSGGEPPTASASRAAAPSAPAPASASAAVPAREVLERAAVHADAAGSARISFSGTVGDSVSMSGTGAYTFMMPTQGTIEFTSLTFPNQALWDMTILMTPDAYYAGSTAYEEDFGKRWLKLSIAEVAEESLLELGQLVQNDNPALYLRLLQSSADLSAVGEEVVAGTHTTHYRGTVDYAAALDALTPELRAQAEQKLVQAGLETSVVDVWIDDQHQLRQFAQESETPSGRVSVTMTIEEYGVPVNVAPPADEETVELRELTG